VANSLETKCSGVITRRRTTEGRVEESVIDYVIISADLLDDIEELIIDEKQEHALTKITHSKNTVKKVTSDHNVILTKFSLNMAKIKPPKKVEVFNFKNKVNQEKFKKVTSNCPGLFNVFETQEDINIQTEKFMKRLDKCIKKSFKKVRLGTKKPSEYETLYARWVELRHKEDVDSKIETNKLEEELADIIFLKIKDEIEVMNSEDGAINSGKLWKLKKKLHKNFVDPPTAMKNSRGKLLTEKGDILAETLNH
jgi:hypothetical protein